MNLEVTNLEIISMKNNIIPHFGSIVYYISDRRNCTIYDIARQFDVEEILLREELIYVYNGFAPNGAYGFHPRIYFDNRNDVEKALHWLESLLVVQELTK